MKEERLFKGLIFDLVRATFKDKDQEIVRDIIRHNGGVGILVVDQDQVLLVKQFRHAIDCETWEIPAGKLEKGEDPKSCGIRELNEETGFECSSLSLFSSFYTTPGFCDERIYLFEAIHPKKAENKLEQDPNENVSHQWFSLEQAKEMILSGKIEDAKTIIAIQYALSKRKDI